MRKITRNAAGLGVALLALTGCSGTTTADDPATASPEPTQAAETVDTPEPTEDPTDEPAGEPTDDETISYAYDGDELSYAETWSLVYNMWAQLGDADHAAFCDERANLGDDETHRQLQAVFTAEDPSMVLDHAAVFDFFEDAC